MANYSPISRLFNALPETPRDRADRCHFRKLVFAGGKKWIDMRLWKYSAVGEKNIATSRNLPILLLLHGAAQILPTHRSLNNFFLNKIKHKFSLLPRGMGWCGNDGKGIIYQREMDTFTMTRFFQSVMGNERKRRRCVRVRGRV